MNVRTIIAVALLAACQSPSGHHTTTDTAARKPIQLITLDPGHFHAALVQKSMYADVDSTVYVYAPDGPDVRSHLDKIDAYDHRATDPTHWSEKVYTGPDFLQKMLEEKKGNTVVLAGNNREKTDYILQALRAGFHVLGDKPMVIDDHAFGELERAFDTAAAHSLVLYDIMTERYEITSTLQRELARLPDVFGTLEKGSPGHPAVVAESTHRWYKYVSGNALTRPAWFFDVDQQGEGIVDVMTHLVDLVQWGCFPDQTLDYKKDIQVDHARHWTTDLTSAQFKTITHLDSFPSFLRKAQTDDTTLKIYANGEIDYRLRGVYVRTTATWTYKAPPGADDTYSSVMHGSKADLIIRQDSAQQYHPTLYIEPVKPDAAYTQTLAEQFSTLEKKYPGIRLQPNGKNGKGWTVIIPDSYKEGHEAHFARVTQKFLEYVEKKDMPTWEVPNMIAKYYTTTTALSLARGASMRTASIPIETSTATPTEADTLTAGVFPSNPTVLKGATRDLSSLDISLQTIRPNETFTPSDNADHLVIVKEGNIVMNTKPVGPGGIGLFAASNQPTIHNSGKINASVYLFSFRSRLGADQTRGKQSPPFIRDWSELVLKKTDKGESRAIFSQSTTWLKNINMHATTLDPGQISHPQHMHRAEEILLLRSGEVRMHIADGYKPARGGDLVFLPSGVPHNLENGNTGRTEYFALQWEP